MRPLFITFTILLLLSGGVAPSIAPAGVYAEDDIPSYAKWGRLAMKETRSKYHDADIVDYLHRGREDKGESTVEKFKLWLREGDKEFGVFIDIEFNSKTGDVLDISFRETSQ